ncbi:hypothetical protein [Chelativorans xinjiangense]|nr:hypothetical protein [Chelativorans xinjiangense]
MLQGDARFHMLLELVDDHGGDDDKALITICQKDPTPIVISLSEERMA